MGLVNQNPIEPHGDRHCRMCNGYRSAQSICVPGRGNEGIAQFPSGGLDVLFVGEAPGKQEDEEGTCFVGKSGAVLDQFIHDYLRGKTYYITNAVRCHLGFKPNREPVKPQAGTKTAPGPFRACRKYLEDEISYLKPKLIVPLGQYATAQVLGIPVTDVKMHKMMTLPLATQWKGKDLLTGRDSALRCFPINHPAWVLYMGMDRFGNGPGVDRWDRQWEAMIAYLEGRKVSLPGEWNFIEDETALQDFYETDDCVVGRDTIALDYETTGLDPWRDGFRMVGFASSGQRGSVHLLHTPAGLDIHQRFLQRLNSDRRLIVHSFTMELPWQLVKFGALPKCTIIDTKILHFLLDERRSHRLEDIIDERAPKYAGFKRATESIGVLDAPDPLLAERCSYDCMATWTIAKDMWEEIGQQLRDFYLNVIESSMRSLVHCRVRGWNVDRPRLEQIKEDIEEGMESLIEQAMSFEEIKRYEDHLNINTGPRAKRKEINLNSNKMGPEMLQQFCGVCKDTTKYEAKYFQANHPTWLKMADGTLSQFVDEHPMVQIILDYRDLIKTRAFVNNMLLYSKLDGLLHPGYNWGGRVMEGDASGTVSGRPSCAKPNLMNLPRHKGDGNEYMQQLRACIISRWEGGQIGSWDYQQIELRMMGILSGEKAFLDEYRKGAEADFHQRTADEMNVSRYEGKTGNFATSYFAMADTLAEALECSREKAQKFITKYWDTYPDLEVFFQRTKRQAVENGYLESPFGMRLHLDRHKIKAHDMRRAGNWIVQHCAAILTFQAQGIIDQEMQVIGYKSMVIGQLYDSIYIDIHPDDNAEEINELVKDVMEDLVPRMYDWINIPLLVDFNIGPTMAGRE